MSTQLHNFSNDATNTETVLSLSEIREKFKYRPICDQLIEKWVNALLKNCEDGHKYAIILKKLELLHEELDRKKAWDISSEIQNQITNSIMNIHECQNNHDKNRISIVGTIKSVVYNGGEPREYATNRLNELQKI